MSFIATFIEYYYVLDKIMKMFCIGTPDYAMNKNKLGRYITKNVEFDRRRSTF